MSFRTLLVFALVVTTAALDAAETEPLVSDTGAEISQPPSSERQGSPTVELQAAIEQSESLSNAEVYQRTLRGTVFIVNDIGGGKRMIGTGWLVDKERRLVVTNDHVIEGARRLAVFFPANSKGRVVTEREHYLKAVAPVEATIVDSDARCDLALVKLVSVADDAVPITLAQHSPSPGDVIHSIGNPSASDALWIYTSGTVRSVYRFKEPKRDGKRAFEARVVESQSPVNPGDSGGPVVNERGELVAVVSRGRTDARLIVEFVDVEEVREYLKTALPLASPQTAEQFNKRGLRHYIQCRYDMALNDFVEAVRKMPEYRTAAANRAWTLYQQDDYATALADFNVLIDQGHKTSHVYHGRGMTYRALGRMDEATSDLTEVVRQAPEDAGGYVARGRVYFAAKKYQEAIQDFTRAIELKPSHPAHFHRGCASSWSGRYAEALLDFDEAIHRHPHSASYYNWRGYSHSRLRHVALAINDYSLAIKLDATKPVYFADRGDLYMDFRQYQLALDDYDEAITLDPKNPNWYTKRAKALQQPGLKDAAESDVRKAAELKPPAKRSAARIAPSRGGTK